MVRVLVGFVLSGLAVLPALAGPDPGSYAEGIEYKRIRPPQPTQAPEGNVEVVELFWYGCPHCYRFEPHLSKWLERKSEHVTFVRIPAQLNPGWEVHAAAFYTAEVLGVAEKIHRPLFDAIHAARRRLNTPEALADFAAEQGVDRESFLRTFDSFAVRAKLAHARDLVKAYGARSVPTMVVDGKYLTNAEMAGGSYQSLLDVVDYLVQKEAEAGR
ncbi:MAG: thiol:disulfide interchange protein DsbA/DsbL [Gammaproteobacteria bacterium]|nr:thiol:disulfide interchange protein DsbA/DsbL [Gammaproteobacteria bacterium]NIR97502.1 thiol:disulfide interchange protein DsbA/DsbL [Gammaproteobacteria bacterium]NIT63140.1 thiol:disulfide interchange protein DsbA/DsbL [Gammaproteobacteria bacterium]NIV19259.1 thioredoxin domain-containing protein [Gammaproteobacteria bacterium]NIX10249.1 thioredoxin domain-containing protein [Gammaproteobacteria bacterium]